MEKFMVIYQAPEEFMEQAATSSPEDMKKGMEQWMVWAEKCGDGLVDMGTPLGGGQKLLPDGSSANSSGQAVGYSVLQAENLDAAKAMLQGHPHLAWNGACKIEVYQMMPVPGQ
ncbi:MAG TPA: hypothetical protein ENI20_11800 [Bacteroides sp.]|nr:hypothetical protein [Bacteroides sp.]